MDLCLLCVSKGLDRELTNVVGKVIQVTPPCEMAALWYYIHWEDLH